MDTFILFNLIALVSGFVFAIIGSVFQLNPFPRFECDFTHHSRNVTLSGENWMQNVNDMKRLTSKMRNMSILCMIAAKDVWQTRAVRETWAQRCNESLFFGEFGDIETNAKSGEVIETRVICRALLHAIDKYKFDWIIIAEDTAFVVIHNLRTLLATLDEHALWSIGRPSNCCGVPHNRLDAGIVLSVGVLQQWKRLFKTEKYCDNETLQLNDDIAVDLGSSKFEMSVALILQHFGVDAFDTRDAYGKQRFHSKYPEFYYERGEKCCSDTAVTFNSLEPTELLVFNYWVYDVYVHTEYS